MEKSLTDKELIQYILGSIEFILDWTAEHSETTFASDLMTNDAVCHRLKRIGWAALQISDDFKNRTSEFPWELLTIHEHHEYPDDVLWHIIKGDDVGTMNSCFSHLETIYLTKHTKDRASKSQYTTKGLNRDYKYHITTKHSIWTVIKK